MVDIPVLGLGETSMLTACMMGSRFCLVGVNPYFGGRFEENVARYGLRERLAGHRVHGADAARARRLLLRRAAPCRRAIESFVAPRAPSLDAGGRGGHPGRRPHHGVPQRERASARSTAPRCSTAPLADRRGRGGRPHPRVGRARFVSRRRLYARAPEASIQQAAAEYADELQPARAPRAPRRPRHASRDEPDRRN